MKKFSLILFMAFVAVSVCAQDWKPVGDNIKTSWAGQVDPSCPLPEYPRPQMVRADWMNLNGLWNYSVKGNDETSSFSEGHILVPFALESSLSGVGRRLAKDETLLYEREFTVPKKWKGKNVLLSFLQANHAIIPL